MVKFSPSRGPGKQVKSEACGFATSGARRRPSICGRLDVSGPQIEGRPLPATPPPPRPQSAEAGAGCWSSDGCQSPACRGLPRNHPGSAEGGRGDSREELGSGKAPRDRSLAKAPIPGGRPSPSPTPRTPGQWERRRYLGSQPLAAAPRRGQLARSQEPAPRSPAPLSDYPRPAP